jgi:TPR repeat protein
MTTPSAWSRHLGVAALGLATVLALAAPAQACPKADPLYHQGVYERYVEELNRLAQAGDVACMTTLGKVLRDGVITPRKLGEAIGWYQKASDAGDPVSQFELASLYDNGFGVPKDHALAAQWYEKSAKQGYIMAIRNLAVMYDEGVGVPQDKARAKALYEEAEEGGNGLDWLPK